MIYWVLDCCVLENCNEENCNHEHYFNCISLLIKIKDSDGICMDDKNQILKEYLDHIRPNTFLSKWWKLITTTTGKMYFCSSHLPKRHIAKLSKLQFHNDDLKYVGTTYNSPDRNLVTFESDYNTEIVDYLGAECNINVLHPCNCYQI